MKAHTMWWVGGVLAAGAVGIAFYEVRKNASTPAPAPTASGSFNVNLPTQSPTQPAAASTSTTTSSSSSGSGSDLSQTLSDAGSSILSAINQGGSNPTDSTDPYASSSDTTSTG